MERYPSGSSFAQMFDQVVSRLAGTSRQTANGADLGVERPACAFELCVLGHTQISCAGTQIGFDSEHSVKTLLNLVVACFGAPLSVEKVGQLLWPTAGQRMAQRRLRAGVAATARICGVTRSEGLLQLRGGHLRLNPRARVDALDLLACEECSDRERAQRAVASYRGEPFADFPFESWTLVARERLCAAYVALVRREASLRIEEGRPAAAANLLDVALETEPFAEALYVDAIATDLRLGLVESAREKAWQCRSTLVSIGLAPSAALLTVEQAVGVSDRTRPRA